MDAVNDLQAEIADTARLILQCEDELQILTRDGAPRSQRRRLCRRIAHLRSKLLSLIVEAAHQLGEAVA